MNGSVFCLLTGDDYLVKGYPPLMAAEADNHNYQKAIYQQSSTDRNIIGQTILPYK